MANDLRRRSSSAHMNISQAIVRQKVAGHGIRRSVSAGRCSVRRVIEGYFIFDGNLMVFPAIMNAPSPRMRPRVPAHQHSGLAPACTGHAGFPVDAITVCCLLTVCARAGRLTPCIHVSALRNFCTPDRGGYFLHPREVAMADLFVDESFLASAEAQSLRGFACCGECLSRIAAQAADQGLGSEERARQQWARCAQCSAGTAPWYRRCLEGC